MREVTGGLLAEAGVGAGYDDGLAGVGPGGCGEGDEDLVVEEPEDRVHCEGCQIVCRWFEYAMYAGV